jgi:hypothetical protein
VGVFLMLGGDESSIKMCHSIEDLNLLRCFGYGHFD